MRPVSGTDLVRWEAALSGALALAALAWAAIRGLELGTLCTWAPGPLAAGAATGIALAAFAPLLRKPWAARIAVIRDLKRIWDEILTPLGRELTLRQIVMLAAFSGICEELFFRGVVQTEIGLWGAALLFGMAHPLSPSYVLWAAAVGACFGGLVRATGNLGAPMAAHGVYNLTVLLYLRYGQRAE